MNQAQQELWTKSDLMDVAKYQKTIIWTIVAVILSPSIVPSKMVIAFMIISSLSIYFVYQLAVSLRFSFPWIYPMLGFIPLVNIIVFLVIINQATNRLKKNGIRVGLMGAKTDEDYIKNLKLFFAMSSLVIIIDAFLLPTEYEPENVLETYNLKDGGEYIGKMIKGVAEGQGTALFSGGDKYVGEFKNGKFNGYGTYTFINGNSYTGSFINNKREGKIVASSPNGDKYIGEFKNDKVDGYGIYTWVGGDKYDGWWKNNERDGYGIYTWANGEYVGKWKGDTYNGQGTFTWLNGNYYTGSWVNGKMEGHGVFFYADGRKYVGEYANNTPIEGRGELYLADGSKSLDANDFKSFVIEVGKSVLIDVISGGIGSTIRSAIK